MKKIFALSLIILTLLASVASAEVLVGRHNMLNFTEEELVKLMNESLSREFYVGIDVTKIALKYYDSLVMLQMALDKGEIEVMTLPLCVGQFVLNSNKDYIIKGIDWWFISSACTFNCAFLEENKNLQERFNAAIRDMKNKGVLALIEEKYINELNPNYILPVEFEKFDGAETITVAVTGDMPPIDYIAPDGTPAGYNTAVLSEIGKRLRVNIKTVNVDTGARAAALKSGRVDVVFWFQSNMDSNIPAIDVPEGVILSEPYYDWNEQYFIGKK